MYLYKNQNFQNLLKENQMQVDIVLPFQIDLA